MVLNCSVLLHFLPCLASTNDIFLLKECWYSKRISNRNFEVKNYDSALGNLRQEDRELEVSLGSISKTMSKTGKARWLVRSFHCLTP
jgi:hypothetical protein